MAVVAFALIQQVKRIVTGVGWVLNDLDCPGPAEKFNREGRPDPVLCSGAFIAVYRALWSGAEQLPNLEVILMVRKFSKVAV